MHEGQILGNNEVMRNHFAKNLLAFAFSQRSEVPTGKYIITIIGNDKEQKMTINNNQKVLEYENKGMTIV